MWWGYSQALDLLEENYDSDINHQNDCGDKEFTRNILLIGQSDCRHVLKTIAQKYRHNGGEKINFFVYEPLLENIARELLFITLALEPAEHIGLFEKTMFFLELYGNSVIRPSTNNYLTAVSKRLLNVITNFDYGQKILPSVSLEKLKYKERDQLEIIFKYWALKDGMFDILKSWDDRLRKYLGSRYDSRSGVYDWDYHMRYKCYGADVLQMEEYKRFRERGIAFYINDTDPCTVNVTLASAISSIGSKILSYGYLGDIITGPYATYGFQCEDKDMFQKVNGHMRKTATDITERNIMRLLYEIEHQNAFVPLSTKKDECTVVLKDESNKIKIQPEMAFLETSKIKKKTSFTTYHSLDMNNCKITFLPLSALDDFPRKPQYENFFDTAFIGQPLVLQRFKPELAKTMKPKGIFIVETPKFLLNYRKEDLEKFKFDLENLMAKSKCTLVNPCNYEKDEFIRFIVDK